MKYDPADRLVAESGPHHADGVWRLYGYDMDGRQVVTVDFSMTEAQANTYASACRFSELKSGGSFAGYTMPGAPSYGTVVSASYYDNYDFIPRNSLPSEFGFKYVVNVYGAARAGLVSKGLLTGIYTGKGYEAYYYNLYGQLIQTYGTGFNAGRMSTFYNTMGDVSKRLWELPDGREQTISWSYDSMRRPTGMTVSCAGADGETISQTIEYNGAGLPAKESWGNATKTMTYDVVGRLTESSTAYARPTPPKPPKPGPPTEDDEAATMPMSAAVTPPQPGKPYTVYERLVYDGAGRIAAKTFTGGSYTYGYDSRGRLVLATTSGSDDFSETYTYDDRCNITSLVRKGVVDKSGTSNVYGTLDDMTFGYTGNKLTSVSNSSEAIAFEGMTGLGKSGSFTKTYDASGRLLTDTSRGITNITYNNEGLPIRVKFSDWSEQEYEWDGLGNHLSTTYSGVSYTGKPYTKLIRKYTGDGRMIDNGVEIYERYPGGYMQDSTYCFYVRDYQGNNLAVMDGDKKLIQQTDYYPYGEPWKEPTGQPWLYSGNERLRLDGINEYDFNARRFNSVEGRFSSWDLLNEKYPWLSPFSYCGGDPVNAVDKSGRDIFILNSTSGMHLAMLIQNEENKWSYYSVNGDNMSIFGLHFGGRPFDDINIGCWASPEEFLMSDYNRKDNGNGRGKTDLSVNHYGFEEGYLISTTQEEDNIMREQFSKISKTTYNPFTNNCATAVQYTLQSVNIPIDTEYKLNLTPVTTQFGLIDIPNGVTKIDRNDYKMIPSHAFHSIMFANPEGKYINKADLQKKLQYHGNP